MPDMPIYATRPTGDGTIGTFHLSPQLALLTFFLVVANVLGWSIFGLLTLTMKVVSSLGG